MANRLEDIYKKLFPEFEWMIPNILSVLPYACDIIQGTPHEFCDGNWIPTIGRSIYSLYWSLRKKCSAGQHNFSHKTVVSIKSFIVKENGMESLFSEYVIKVYEMKKTDIDIYGIKRDFMTDKKGILKELQQTDGLKIICKFICLACPVKLAYVQIVPNNELDILKRKHSEEEVVEFTGSKMKMLRPSGVDTLLRHIKNLLTTGEDSDVTIKVKDREFSAHKNILQARSPVFFELYSHDMEKKDGIINIDDCKPEAFQEFLNYLYTGELDYVSIHIMYGLYYIGGKYGVDEITKSCVISMPRYLSVDTFCEILTFAQLNKESTILEAASEFFIKNLKAVISTDQWLSFLRKHPVTANELHIKAADHTNAQIKKLRLSR